ncbi:hypothetical protein GGS21DRAFT_218181 [Xylaria nigripes]|nr:hypothetical protein GGS21DRAFT_218181 [Xylaria nigripes]
MFIECSWLFLRILNWSSLSSESRAPILGQGTREGHRCRILARSRPVPDSRLRRRISTIVDCRLSNLMPRKKQNLLGVLAISHLLFVFPFNLCKVSIFSGGRRICRWGRASLSAASIECAEFLKSIQRSGIVPGDKINVDADLYVECRQSGYRSGEVAKIKLSVSWCQRMCMMF